MPGDHGIGDLVRVLLMGVTSFAHATFELHATALLHDVGRLMCCRVEARRAGERDGVASRVRLGAERG